jgi:DNA-directed RNA polymerase specialized sigma24 family protein
MGNEQDAQEAYLRAFRFFPGFRGGDVRAWLMKIVRNTFYTWLRACLDGEFFEGVSGLTYCRQHNVSEVQIDKWGELNVFEKVF